MQGSEANAKESSVMGWDVGCPRYVTWHIMAGSMPNGYQSDIGSSVRAATALALDRYPADT